MFKKIYLLLLLTSIPFAAITDPQTAQHYFGFGTWINGSADWLEIKFEFNGQSYIGTFTHSPDPQQYRFPIDEIDVNKRGILQVTEVHYKDRMTGVIYTLPVTDNPACRIEFTPKNAYPHSTVTQLWMNTSGCGGLNIYPYTDN
jgi:hypothetical protein